MNMRIIEVPFTPNVPVLLKRLGLDADSDEAEDFLALLEKAAPVARPKAALAAVRIDAVEPSGLVRMGGVEFHSGLLAKNLAETETAWPFLVTCGRELYDFVMAIPDPFERYWGDEIMQEALGFASEAARGALHDEHYQGKVASMTPGSLVDWPIGEQVPLFRLFGDTAAKVGVTLTDSLLMIPNKSVSGIRFPNEHGYVNCRLCPKERCHNRKAEYDADLALMEG